jgi:hypothetical protein
LQTHHAPAHTTQSIFLVGFSVWFQPQHAAQCHLTPPHTAQYRHLTPALNPLSPCYTARSALSPQCPLRGRCLRLESMPCYLVWTESFSG